MFKKIIAVILSVVLMSSAALCVSAETNEVQPRFSYTSSTITGLSITTSGKAYCTANLDGYSGLTTKVKITMTLQKKTLLWWSEVETWTGTFNTFYGFLSETKTVSSGKYRVKAVYVAYSGSKSEEITSYSQEKSY